MIAAPLRGEECMQRPIILASGSPRRVELMRQMGLEFEAVPVDVDEHLAGKPHEVVAALARRKAMAALQRYPDRYILAADTLVHAQGEVLGKPADQDDARRMLALLSGSEHQVFTGVCVLHGQKAWADCVCTQVRFAQLSAGDIAGYVQSGEPMDKAGAYAVQGMGGMFVTEVHGSPSNVIGLPMHTVRALLAQAGYFD